MTGAEHSQDRPHGEDPVWGPEDQGPRPGVPLGRADQQPPPEEVQEKAEDLPSA